MKQNELIHLIRNPQAVSIADLDDLNVFTKEFPFFQTAQLLYTIGIKDNAPQHYQKQLRKTAIIANNRTVLYELLHPAVKETRPVEPATDNTVVDKQVLAEPAVEADTRVSHTTVSNDDVKVIYVTTTVEKPEARNKVQDELDILKDIENHTEETPVPFNEEKLNKDIEREISKQLIDSYVQTEIIRTPELHEDKQSEATREDTGTEPGSFVDWLKKVQRTEKIEQKTAESTKNEGQTTITGQKVGENQKFEEKKKLIDKIIESDPGKIRLQKDKFFSATQDAKQSLLENEHLITETLAKIYALQGNVSKAIRAYEILSLKFPQKSVYFASLIEKLKTK